MCWSTDTVGHAAVLVADGKLLLLTDEGQLILAQADPAAYRELAHVQLFESETCWTPPTLSQGRLFVRSPSHAVCLYVGSPEHLGKEIAISPIVQQSRWWRFNPAWLASRERDYPNDAPTQEEMATWFGACMLIVFGGGALGTGLILLLARLFSVWRPAALPVFLTVSFALGLLGPNLFSALADCFLFTWPASLYTRISRHGVGVLRGGEKCFAPPWALVSAPGDGRVCTRQLQLFRDVQSDWHVHRLELLSRIWTSFPLYLFGRAHGRQASAVDSGSWLGTAGLRGVFLECPRTVVLERSYK